jgi:Protein of unknown function (DUF1579)
MSDNKNNQPMQMPTPDPALKALDRLVGTWSMEGNLAGATEKNIKGQTTFRWLPGGFFLEQHMKMNFMGMEIDSLELVGYNPQAKTLASTVFSNMSPMPLPYTWEMDGNVQRITVDYAGMDAKFEGKFSADGNSFTGGWRPNPGADANINFAYDIGGTRIK